MKIRIEKEKEKSCVTFNVGDIIACRHYTLQSTVYYLVVQEPFSNEYYLLNLQTSTTQFCGRFTHLKDLIRVVNSSRDKYRIEVYSTKDYELELVNVQ